MLEDTSRRELLSDLERNFESYLTMVLIVMYTALIVYKILTRAVPQAASPVWLQEVTIGLFIWASWVSVASLVRTDSHIRIIPILERFPQRGVYLVYWVEWVLWFALAGTIFRYSIPYVAGFVRSAGTITGTSVPQYYLFLSIPVGFALILVRTLQQIIIITRKYRAGEELATGTDISGADS